MIGDALQACEGCGREVPLDECAITADDCWLCKACQDGFAAAFRTCDHAWEAEHDANGDAGRYCTKCAGFIVDDLFDITEGVKA